MQSINSSASIQRSKSFDSLPANETIACPRSPSFDDMRAPFNTSPLTLKLNKFEIIRDQLKDVIKNNVLKDKSIPIGTALELHRVYLENTLKVQQGGNIKWPEIPQNELVDKVNSFFNDAVDKFAEIPIFPSESLLLFKENGVLRKFCLFHIDNLPAKDLLGSLEYFVNKLCQSSSVLRENALHIFPPPSGHYKYTVCVAGMHITLNEAILSLDDSHPIQIHQSQIIINIIDKFVGKNNVLRHVYEGHHVHIPLYFLSLVYPDSLIEKIDDLYLLPRDQIPTHLKYKFLKDLPIELQKESNNILSEHLETGVNEELSGLAKYINDATHTILSMPVDNIDYKEIDDLKLLKHINVRSMNIIPNVINEITLVSLVDNKEISNSHYAWDEQDLKTILFEKTLTHITKPFVNFESSVNSNAIVPTFKELFEATVPSLLELKNLKNIENFIDKIYILSMKPEESFRLPLLRTLHNLGINTDNISRFENAKSILENLKSNLPSDRGDLKHRLSCVQEQINILQNNSSEEPNNILYKKWIESDLIPLETLLNIQTMSKFKTNFSEIEAALKKECAYNPDYKLPEHFNISFIIHHPDGMNFFNLLEKYCSNYTKIELFTPAIANGKTELVKILFEQCIESININNIRKLPITNAFDKNNVDIVSIFLEQHHEFVQHILKNPGLYGSIPLHDAARLDSPDILQLLLAADASPRKITLQIKNDSGERALDIAVDQDKPENVKSILKFMSAHTIILNTLHKTRLMNLTSSNIYQLLKEYPSQNFMSTALTRLGKKISS